MFRRETLATDVRRVYRQLEGKMRARHWKWAETQYAIQGRADIRIIEGRPDTDWLRREISSDGLYLRTNVMHQQLRAMVASSFSREPVPHVSPGVVSHDATMLAQANERMLRWFYQTKGFDIAQLDALIWSFSADVAYLGVQWDAMAAAPVRVPVTDSNGQPKFKIKKVPALDENGQPRMSEYAIPPHPIYEDVLEPVMKWDRLGDLRFFAPSPFSVFPQPASDWDRVGWVIIRDYRAHEDVVEEFGSKAKGLPADVAPEDIVWLDGQDSDGYSLSGAGAAVPMTRLLHLYEKPTTANPKGRHVVVGGEMVLTSEDLPCGMLPIAPVYDQRLPGRLFGLGGLTQCVDIQRALNAAETDNHRNRRVLGNPIFRVDVDGKDKANRIAGILGAVRREDKAEKPAEWIQPPNIPSYITQEPERLRFVMREVGGAQSPMEGSAEGTGSGRHAAIVIAEGRAKLMPAVRSLARATEHCSRLALKLWKTYGDKEKTISVMGPNGGIAETAVFYRHYIDDGIEVRIDATTMMPENEEVRRQRIMEMWQLGMIPDIYTANRLLRFGELNKLLGTDDETRMSARQAIDLMRMGQEVEAFWFEKHEVWLDEILPFVRSWEYRALPKQIRNLFDAHLQSRWDYLNMANSQNPVLAGASPMPQLPAGGNGGVQNGAPTLNGANGAFTQPGLTPGAEAEMV